jgi:hypothetical protein
MATEKQRAAARKNIKKAAKAAKRKQTLKHLPKKTRRALGQQAAKVRQSRRWLWSEIHWTTHLIIWHLKMSVVSCTHAKDLAALVVLWTNLV